MADVPPWVIAVAGSSGAIVANAITYPLDIVKTRLQVQIKKSKGTAEKKDGGDSSKARHYNGTLHAMTDIIEQDGILGMYSGLPGASLSTAGTNFVYFYAYSTLRVLFSSHAGKSILADLGLGTAAGVVVSFAISPISVVTTTQQTDQSGKSKSMLQTAKDIVNGPSGWTGLWSGIKPSLILSVNPAITYGAYEQLRTIVFPKTKSLKPHEAFLLGALSKMIATVITQPLIVAKATLQSRRKCHELGRPFKSFQEVLYYIVKNEGVLALYKGMKPQLLKGFLVQGILMMIKERVELIFVLLFRYFKQVKA